MTPRLVVPPIIRNAVEPGAVSPPKKRHSSSNRRKSEVKPIAPKSTTASRTKSKSDVKVLKRRVTVKRGGKVIHGGLLADMSISPHQ